MYVVTAPHLCYAIHVRVITLVRFVQLPHITYLET